MELIALLMMCLPTHTLTTTGTIQLISPVGFKPQLILARNLPVWSVGDGHWEVVTRLKDGSVLTISQKSKPPFEKGAAVAVRSDGCDVRISTR